MLDTALSSATKHDTDQAAGLRRMFNAQTLGVLPVSGSWQLVELLARALASQSRVALLDEEGEPLMSAFHKSAEYELADLLSGYRQFAEVAVRVNDKLSLIAAQNGLQKFLQYARDNQLSGESLFAGFTGLARPFRWLLINTVELKSAAALVGGQGEVLLAMPDTPQGIKQAYAQIKEAVAHTPDMQLRIAVQADSDVQAKRVFERFADTTSRFLNLTPQFALALPFEWRISAALADKLRAAMSAWQVAEYVQTESTAAAGTA